MSQCNCSLTVVTLLMKGHQGLTKTAEDSYILCEANEPNRLLNRNV